MKNSSSGLFLVLVQMTRRKRRVSRPVSLTRIHPVINQTNHKNYCFKSDRKIDKPKACLIHFLLLKCFQF